MSCFLVWRHCTVFLLITLFILLVLYNLVSKTFQTGGRFCNVFVYDSNFQNARMENYTEVEMIGIEDMHYREVCCMSCEVHVLRPSVAVLYLIKIHQTFHHVNTSTTPGSEIVWAADGGTTPGIREVRLLDSDRKQQLARAGMWGTCFSGGYVGTGA